METTHTVILMSGGIDSSSVVAVSREAGTQPSGIFVDYGQPAARSEWRAAQRGSHEAAGVAQRAVETLSRELDSGATAGKSRGIKRLAGDTGSAVGKFLTVTGVLRGIGFLRNLLFGG